jgi:type II secretory pathway component PulF
VGKKALQPPSHLKEGSNSVAPLLVVLLLIVILGILGFAVVKFLLWIAVILLIIWLIGFFVRGVEGARWYRW